MQDDRDDYLSMLTSVDFSDKMVAIFGLGNQEGYPDTFVDAIGVLANIVREGGGTVVGQAPTDGYEYDERNTLEPTKRRATMEMPATALACMASTATPRLGVAQRCAQSPAEC